MTGAFPDGDLRRICRRCRHDRPAFERAVGVVRYRGVARTLALALKFGGDRPLARAMAALMVERIKTAAFPPPSAFDVAVPVPLHRTRRRARGYNQAALLSREMARMMALRHRTGGLRRVVATPEQTLMGGAARRSFPKGAFRAYGTWTGCRVLLVDDVITTGATTSACAQALRDAGAATVYAVSFAR